MGFIKDTVEKVREFFGSDGKFQTTFPKDDAPENLRSQSLIELFDEADEWKDFAVGNLAISLSESNTHKLSTDARSYFQHLRYLEDGNHYMVYDDRRRNVGDDWKHRLVDNEIGNQIRVIKAHVTANYHNIAVSPNIDNIDVILDSERKKIGWEYFVTDVVSQCLTEGTAWAKSYVDFSSGLPQVKHILLDNESVFLTPGARDIYEAWYLIVGSIASVQDVQRLYPDFDFTDVNSSVNQQRFKTLSPIDNDSFTYNADYTKFVDVLECWMDDVTTVAKDFDLGVVDGEHNLLEEIVDPTKNPEMSADKLPLLVAGSIPVHDADDHKKHIKAHQEFIDALNVEKLNVPLASEYVDLLTLAVQHHIKMHEMAIKEKPEFASQKKKYPYGRKVVVIGGKLAEDVPSEYQSDWRAYFNVVHNERMPKNAWGRGIAHTLFHSNNILDVTISRIMDGSITTSNPQTWLSWEDKAEMKDGYDNNPLKPKFYKKTPPVFRSANTPPENIKLYEIFKNISAKQQGVNSITYGEDPGGSASGVMVDSLQRQNAILVTGEINRNLNKFVEGVMKAHLCLMKDYYTEPRIYFVNGVATEINIAYALTYENVKKEDGSFEEREIPLLDVKVKPNSNLPNQWDIDFNLALQMAQMQVPPDSVLPKEAVLDLLAQKNPEFGVGGKYYQMSQAMMVGMQYLQQQQAQQEATQKNMDGAVDRVVDNGQ